MEQNLIFTTEIWIESTNYDTFNIQYPRKERTARCHNLISQKIPILCLNQNVNNRERKIKVAYQMWLWQSCLSPSSQKHRHSVICQYIQHTKTSTLKMQLMPPRSKYVLLKSINTTLSIWRQIKLFFTWCDGHGCSFSPVVKVVVTVIDFNCALVQKYLAASNI